MYSLDVKLNEISEGLNTLLFKSVDRYIRQPFPFNYQISPQP